MIKPLIYTKNEHGGDGGAYFFGEAHSSHRNVCHRDNKSSECRSKSSHHNIRNIRADIISSDIVKSKLAVETANISTQCDQETGEGRMEVEEELACQVFLGKTTEMDFIKDNH